MSIEYCHKCDTLIDTDFNAEHFDEEFEGCQTNKEARNLVEKTFFGGKDILADLNKVLSIR